MTTAIIQETNQWWCTPVDDEYDELKEVHIWPNFGPRHGISEFCWCHPDLEENEDSVPIFMHNVVN